MSIRGFLLATAYGLLFATSLSLYLTSGVLCPVNNKLSASDVLNGQHATYTAVGCLGPAEVAPAAAAAEVAQGDGGRLRAHPRILLRYLACTGLMNQQYSHIAAFSVAAALGADIMMPPAICRDSYGKINSLVPEENEMLWSPVASDTLWDFAAIAETWRRLGITVHSAPQLQPFPDTDHLRTAFPMYTLPEWDPRQIVQLSGVSRQPRDLWEYVAMARAALASAFYKLAQEGVHFDTLVLDLPCTYLSLRTTSALPLVGKVALSLAFNPQLRALADQVVEKMTEGGRFPFNGLHLRMEKDALGFLELLGGVQRSWELYVEAMHRAGFNRKTRVYVASGLLTYGATGPHGPWAVTKSKITEELQLASTVLHKELFIAPSILDGLHTEQVALLDFLVLSRSQRFVGFGASTFSVYLTELRALHGLPKFTSQLVGGIQDKLRETCIIVEDLGAEQGVLNRVHNWHISYPLPHIVGR